MSRKKPRLTDNQIQLIREWANLNKTVEIRYSSGHRSDIESVQVLSKRIDEIEDALGMR
jgi:hypothetical protein